MALKVNVVALWGILCVSSAETHFMGTMNFTCTCLRNIILVTYAKGSIQGNMTILGTMMIWTLETHFRQEHFLCEDGACLAKKFVVFQTEAEMKRHNTIEHGGHMSCSKRNAALQVPTIASDIGGVMIKISGGVEDVDFILIHPTTNCLWQFKLAWRQQLQMVELASYHHMLFRQLLTRVKPESHVHESLSVSTQALMHLQVLQLPTVKALGMPIF